MPDPKALTPEQINLLRGLPVKYDDLLTDGELKSDQATWERLRPFQEIARTPFAEYVTEDHRPEQNYRFGLTVDGCILLATIDSAVAAERERVLEAIVGDLENAATDCDGHTPYSILMALAEEIRAEHSANPQTKEAGQ